MVFHSFPQEIAGMVFHSFPQEIAGMVFHSFPQEIDYRGAADGLRQ